MTVLLFLAIALAGGLGAGSRFVLDGVIRSRVGAALPWGTITINLTGSFGLGLLVGLVGASALTPETQLVLGTGFLGGYTTFSTASYESVRLLQQRRWVAAATNALGTLVAGTVLAGIGMAVGSLA